MTVPKNVAEKFAKVRYMLQDPRWDDEGNRDLIEDRAWAMALLFAFPELKNEISSPTLDDSGRSRGEFNPEDLCE